MKSISNHALGALAALLFAVTANAQVCKETSSTSASNFDDKHGTISCDMSYRDAVITCGGEDLGNNKVAGTRYPCPAKPMPMLKTPLKSPIAEYTEQLFAYARDADDKSKMYNGPFSVGTEGGADRVFGMTAVPAGTNPKLLAGCIQQYQLGSAASTKEEALQERFKLDACSNQYIVFAAAYPYQPSRSRQVNDPQVSSAFTSPQTECQPLSVYEEKKNEYNAGDYMVAAKTKLFDNPSYKKNSQSTTEPTMPKGIRIKNDALKFENLFPDLTKALQQVRLSQSAKVPYEQIYDPTHPYTPRWDFSFTEREQYSPLTSKYMEETENQVYCAGVRDGDDSQGNDSEFSTGSDQPSKEDKEVKVDVLKFRQKTFETGLTKRIDYNNACKDDDNDDKVDIIMESAPLPTIDMIKMVAGAYCYKINRFPIWFEETIDTGQAERVPCWKCFGLDGKLAKDKKPPCSTHHDEGDLSLDTGYLPGGKNGMAFQASCNPSLPYTRNDDHAIDKLCRDLRAPLTPINKLKMRYHNPDDKEYDALPDGVPEGYSFKEYFGNHMPYMRLWDTGSSIQKTDAHDMNDQDAKDTLGQYTSIVGVGREGAVAKASDEDRKKHPDERCKIGGWGGNASFGGVTIRVPDPITSWTELKLYQARTLRNANISCLGRYEKVFKPGSSESLALMPTGGEWMDTVISKCPVNKSSPCTWWDLETYRKKGSPQSDRNTVYTPQTIPRNWPNGWRGYLADGTGGGTKDNQFPNFGKQASTTRGLDTVEKGDLILMPLGATTDTKRPGLAKVALVADADVKDGCEKRKGCFVQVLEGDNGKWPDVCGTTDANGELKSRVFYKKGNLPKPAQEEFSRIGSGISCIDTKLGQCVFEPWDSIMVYKIRKDVREGCGKSKSSDCTT